VAAFLEKRAARFNDVERAELRLSKRLTCACRCSVAARGLTLAILLKRHDPAHQVRVVERGRAARRGASAGVLRRALDFLVPTRQSCTIC